MFSMVGLYICLSLCLSTWMNLLESEHISFTAAFILKHTYVHAVRYSHSPGIMAWHGTKVQKIQEYS